MPAGLLLLLVRRRLPAGVWWWRSLVPGVLNMGAFFALIYLFTRVRTRVNSARAISGR